ncbi:MAG: hypothetical protein K6F53_06420 [Lachnospiraceae bacterium]|nr:hypothetical protein [Lachnospiraceae bacterium]
MKVSGITSVNMAGGVNPAASAARPAVHGARDTGRAAGAERLREDNEARAREKDEKKAEQRKEELKDLIAVSKDGDTAQASENAKELLSEDRFGSVRKIEAGDQDEQKNAPGRINADEEERAGINAQNPAEKEEPSAGEKLAEEAREAEEARRTEERARIEAGQKAEAEERSRIEAEQKAEAAERREKAEERREEREAAEAEREERTAGAAGQDGQSPEAANGNRGPAAAGQENNPANNRAITSLKSYTETQLEQLYEQGQISKTDYDKEVENRKELREDRQEQDREFSENTVRGIGLQEKAERDEEELKNAFSEDANDNLNPGERIAMINAADEMTR